MPVSSSDLLARLPPCPPRPPSAEEHEVGPFDPLPWQQLPHKPSASLVVKITAEPIVGRRSEQVAAVAKQMLHEGFTREEVAGVLLCADNAISDHVLDQPDPERAARRMAARAQAPQTGDTFGDSPDPSPPTPVPVPDAPMQERTGTGVMDLAQQLHHFQGCVYVSGLGEVLMPDGQLLGRPQFDVVKGGYSFVVTNDGKTDKSAWLAFTQNQRYAPTIAVGTCFRPERPPRAVILDDGWSRVNAYVPIDTPAKDGDPTPFLAHLRLLLPDPRDREILVSYLATCVQRPGHKAQWWPVVQGVQGNGKSVLGNIMHHAMGARYFHTVNAAKLVRKGLNFNGWMRNKLFLTVEEIPTGARPFLEEFKPYVTNRILSFEPKGIEEQTGDNRCNGIILTNNRDGVPINKDERRYAPLFTAQQTVEDMYACGMCGDYFPRLWRWLDDDGFAIITHFLRNYPIDPVHESRAPTTSSTTEALVEGRTLAEQLVLEAIDDEEPGFRGGWVSSAAVTRKLKDANLLRGPKAIAKIISLLGYEPHPALNGKGTPAVIEPDRTRPRLYCRPTAFRSLLTAESVMEAYSLSQALTARS